MAIDPIFQQAVQYHHRGQLAQAQALYEEILRVQPRHFDALHLLGVIAAQSRNPERALTMFDRALGVDRTNAVAHFNKGTALQDLKQWQAALASYDRAIAIKPDFAEACSNRGVVLAELGQLPEALDSCNQALAIKNDFAEAFFNRGNVYRDLKQWEAAVHSYDQAVSIRVNYAEAFFNRGNVQREQGSREAALRSYDQSIALRPDFAPAYANRGNVQRELKQWNAALASYDRLIALEPKDADAHFNRGIVLTDLGRLEAALAAYSLALALRADFAEAYLNRGNLCRMLKRYEPALLDIEHALAIKPELADAWYSLGDVQTELRRYPAAAAAYERAFSLKPDIKLLLGKLSHARMWMCAWDDFDADVARLAASVARDELAAEPFVVSTLSGSAALLRRTAEIWVREEYPPNFALPPIAKHGVHGKLRIGYFSPDFRNHPVSVLMAEVFEGHDRSRFDVMAFSLGPDTQDPMRQRLQNAFDRFIDIGTRSDQEVALLARSMELDIAVDLAGFTHGSRPGIFALRAAPLQVSYLGYPGTMAAPYMDYLIADPVIVPPELRAHYTEGMLYLPSYQANDSTRRIAEKIFTRQELGLPASGFVFCCFNAAYKITPSTFGGWMRILQRVPGSVLLLRAGGEEAASNLQKEAQRRGVDPARLVFGKPTPAASDYLARYRTADLFLDTLPYNAHTTASDALWAGLPVLTCAGESFASRVAASVLTAVGLPELIASTPENYEDCAVALATDADRLASIKQRLAVNRLSTPLFDSRAFTRNLETAYQRICERYQGDLPPDDIGLV